MIHFNLMPWRERQQKEKRIYYTWLMLSISSAMILNVILYFVNINARYHLRLNILNLQNRIPAVIASPVTDDKIMKSNLQANHLLLRWQVEILRTLADPIVCFTQFKFSQQRAFLQGYAKSAYDFAKYFKRTNLHHYFSQLTIVKIQQLPDSANIHFVMQAVTNASSKSS